jgi:hypothetical protein
MHSVLVMQVAVAAQVETESSVVARVASGYLQDEVLQQVLVVVVPVVVHLTALPTSLHYSLCFSPLVNNVYFCE